MLLEVYSFLLLFLLRIEKWGWKSKNFYRIKTNKRKEEKNKIADRLGSHSHHLV